MPLNSKYGDNNYSNVISTFNDVVTTIRYSNNKNDAIRTLKNTTIKGTDVKIGEQYAHEIYNKYAQYNGNTSARRKY